MMKKKPKKKYTRRQQIDQKSMEFQDKINKCHVDILDSLATCVYVYSEKMYAKKTTSSRQWKWHSA